MQVFKVTSYLTSMVAMMLCSCHINGPDNGIPLERQGQTAQRDSIIASRLEELQAEVTSDTLACIEFFDLFPNNFEDFVNIYGYVEYDTSVMFGSLYDRAYDHIESLASSSCKSIDEVGAKMMNIAINGRWQADAANYLQRRIISYMINDTDSFVREYYELNRENRISVWYFALDGPIERMEIPYDIASALMDNANIIDEAEIALRDIQSHPQRER